MSENRLTAIAELCEAEIREYEQKGLTEWMYRFRTEAEFEKSALAIRAGFAKEVLSLIRTHT